MTEKKVKNIDGKLIEVIIDEPGSITDYDRLLNGRAPVAVENDGSPVGQSDILNFILPSGSSVVPNGPKIDISIGGVENQFIFRPGGVAQGNVYTSFISLISDHDASDGPKIIYFDNSLAPTDIPVGTYNFSNTLLSRFVPTDYAMLDGTSIPVNLSIGTIFSGDRLFVHGITLRSLSTSPIMTFPVMGGVILLQEGAELEAPGANSFAVKTGGSLLNPLRVIMMNSRLVSGAFPVFEIDTAPGKIDFHLFGASIIEDDTLENGDPADEINYYIYDTSVIPSITHSGLTITISKILKAKSEFSFFDNTVVGMLVSNNVQDAIDELSGLIGGGGGLIPKKDTFTPTPSQTAFVLSFTPNVLSTFLLTLNGVEQQQGVNYTVAGTALTWLDVPFTLSATDLLIIHYFV